MTNRILNNILKLCRGLVQMQPRKPAAGRALVPVRYALDSAIPVADMVAAHARNNF